MTNELEFAKKLAYDAGEIMRKYFNQTGISHYKSDNTIVTKADTEINQIVIDRVREAYPEYGVYGEEDSFSRDRQALWVCDPLDGTGMFSRGVPVAVFSLALVIDGEPQLGVVYDPWTDKLYSAVKGEGAYCNGAAIKVNQYNLDERGVEMGYDYSPTMLFDTLAPALIIAKRSGLAGTGSFVNDGVLVANGGFSLMIASGNRPYDIAAAKVIVEEAGGKVTNLYGEEQRYDADIKGAIISNSVVHDEVVRIMKEKMK